MGLLNNIIRVIRYYVLGHNYVRSIGSGKIKIASTVCLKNTRIYVYPGASLTIDDNCRINDATISAVKGHCHIGKCNIIEGTEIVVDDGIVETGHHTKLAMQRMWVRFGGQLRIGNYTNINKGSEIRCDESVTIGSYNMISYNVRIWDTNTHCMMSAEERRIMTEQHWPYYGFECSRPATAPVIIGDDCWIGEGAAVLKNSSIGDGSIVGFRTMICGRPIPRGSRVLNEYILKITSLE